MENNNTPHWPVVPVTEGKRAPKLAETQKMSNKIMRRNTISSVQDSPQSIESSTQVQCTRDRGPCTNLQQQWEQSQGPHSQYPRQLNRSLGARMTPSRREIPRLPWGRCSLQCRMLCGRDRRAPSPYPQIHLRYSSHDSHASAGVSQH